MTAFANAIRHAAIVAASCLLVACGGEEDGGSASSSGPGGGSGTGGGTSNAAPLISGSAPTTVVGGQTYQFQPTASDPDGQTLTFAIANRPRWASFNTGTGRLSGTPSNTDAGTYADITISVSDGSASVTLPSFAITVTAANSAPAIGGQPVVAADVGRPYSFRPTASDADGDTLRFSITNAPAWATFEAETGLLYGTPTSANVGSTSGIVISVSDGQASVSLPAFSITVGPAPTGSATLRWTAPTHNIDGSPIVDLSGYEVSYGTVSRNYSHTLPVTAPSSTSVTIEGLTPGTWYFAVKAVNAAGIVSDFSNEASKVL